jgi:hypothetical protein
MKVRRDTRALYVRVGLVRSSRCFGQNEELDVIYAHAHCMSALATRGPSLPWTKGRARRGYTHMHRMSALTSRGTVAALDEMS